MNCNYKVKITDIQTKYKFKVFCTGGNGGSQEEIQELQTQYNTLYNLLPKVTGEGESLSLLNTAEAPLKLDLKGNKGKNLLHQDQYISTTTRNGITFTNNGDGTFSITGTATADTNINILYGDTQIGLKSGKTYYFYSSQPYNSQTFNMSIPFKQDGTQKYLIVNSSLSTSGELTQISLAFYTNSGNTINAQNVKLMLVEGTTAPTTYEPYKPYVTGDNTIKVSGKNLFNDYATTTATFRGVARTKVDNGIQLNGTYNKAGSTDLWLTASENETYTNNMTLLKANTEYTIIVKLLSGTMTDMPGSVILSSRTTDYVFAWNYKVLNLSDNEYKITFTTGASDIYASAIRMTLSTSSDAVFNNAVFGIEICEGEATTYEPYQSQTYQVNIGDTHLNIGDSIEGTIDNWKIVRADTTEEVITDSTLISQLNAIKNSMAYKGATNISQTNDLAPFIINASTLKDLSNL